MGAGVSVSASINDKDVAILETHYLRMKYKGTSGVALMKGLQEKIDEIQKEKESPISEEKVIANESVAAESASVGTDVVGTKVTGTTVAASPEPLDVPTPVDPSAATFTKLQPPSLTVPDDPSEFINKPLTTPHSRNLYALTSPNTIALAKTRVMALMRQVSIEAWSNFMVAVDASSSSQRAIDVCLQELMTTKDGLIAMHCYDSTKSEEGLDPKHKPDAIKEAVEVELMTRTGKGRWALKWVDKAGGDTATTIVRMVNAITLDRENLLITTKTKMSMDAPSYFVTGVNGRKGKECGSLPFLAAGKVHLPNIIVKKDPVVGRGRVFVVTIKSLAQLDLYDISVDLMKPGKGDRVVVLHLYVETFFESGTHDVQGESSNTMARWENEINDMFARDGVNGKFVCVPDSGLCFKSEILLKAIAEEQADYVIIQPSLTMDGKDLSICTRDIITKADCNIVTCKH